MFITLFRNFVSLWILSTLSLNIAGCLVSQVYGSNASSLLSVENLLLVITGALSQ